MKKPDQWGYTDRADLPHHNEHKYAYLHWYLSPICLGRSVELMRKPSPTSRYLYL